MKDIESSIRPSYLKDFIGQEKIKKILEISLFSSNKRKESLDHILLIGQAGLGKTTLANIIANEKQSRIHITSGPALEKSGDLAGLLSNLQAGDIVFIDEIHRLNKTIEELLYAAMEDYTISITVNNNGVSKPLVIPLPPFTLIGATTKMGNLESSFYDRFTFVLSFTYYSEEELQQIIKRSAKILKLKIDDESIALIASRSRNTPRIANKLLRKIRDYYLYRDFKEIKKEDTLEALQIFNVDSLGLENVDQEYLQTIINEYNGGPVGVAAIASRLNQQEANLVEIVEPYLLRQGLLVRGPRGRQVTEKAYKHLNISHKQ